KREIPDYDRDFCLRGPLQTSTENKRSKLARRPVINSNISLANGWIEIGDQGNHRFSVVLQLLQGRFDRLDVLTHQRKSITAASSATDELDCFLIRPAGDGIQSGAAGAVGLRHHLYSFKHGMGKGLACLNRHFKMIGLAEVRSEDGGSSRMPVVF